MTPGANSVASTATVALGTPQTLGARADTPTSAEAVIDEPDRLAAAGLRRRPTLALRQQALGGSSPPRLPIYLVPEATRAVLALEDPGKLASTYDLGEFEAGDAATGRLYAPADLSMTMNTLVTRPFSD